MYQSIKDTLTTVLPTYDPAVKIGEVKAPYAVIHDMGTNAQPGTKGMLGQRVYEIVVLVPLTEQAKLAPLCEAVRQALKALPRIKYTGDAAPTGIEAEFKGASVSLIYRMPVRIQ